MVDGTLWASFRVTLNLYHLEVSSVPTRSARPVKLNFGLATITDNRCFMHKIVPDLTGHIPSRKAFFLRGLVLLASGPVGAEFNSRMMSAGMPGIDISPFFTIYFRSVTRPRDTTVSREINTGRDDEDGVGPAFALGRSTTVSTIRPLRMAAKL